MTCTPAPPEPQTLSPEAVERGRVLANHYSEDFDLGCGPEVQIASAVADLLQWAEHAGFGAAAVLDLAHYHYTSLDNAPGLPEREGHQ